MVLLFLLLTLAGCVVFYLTHPHQNWLKMPLDAAPWRLIALAAVLGGLLAAVSYLPVNAALFAWLVTMMLVIGLLPFAPLLMAGNSAGQGEVACPSYEKGRSDSAARVTQNSAGEMQGPQACVID